MIDDSHIKKHSIVIYGHSTSITLENIFWRALKTIATQQKKSISQLLMEIDTKRDGNLSSATRIYVIRYLMRENYNLQKKS